MSLLNEIEIDVKNTIDTPWDLRKGRVVPSTTDIALSGGTIELDATFLYADLADSSKMAKELDRRVAARIMKSFLATTCRLIIKSNGTIQSFDGDRVMGVFVGDLKNTNATTCALKINHVVTQIIKTKYENKYESVRDATFNIRHGVGVDTGTVMGVRAGARGSNDLIWIGRAPNLAAKMSDIRNQPYSSHITASVYNKLADSAKFSKQKTNMWESCSWNFLGDKISIYRSKWRWPP